MSINKREAPADQEAGIQTEIGANKRRRKKTEAERLADELASKQEPQRSTRRASAPAVNYFEGAATNWGSLVKDVMKDQDPGVLMSVSQIAALVVNKLDPDDPRVDESFMLTRRVIQSGLSRGAYRRRLVSINAEERMVAAKPEHSRERTLVAISFLTLAALQVEHAGEGPWDVVPADDDGGDFFGIEKEEVESRVTDDSILSEYDNGAPRDEEESGQAAEHSETIGAPLDEDAVLLKAQEAAAAAKKAFEEERAKAPSPSPKEDQGKEEFDAAEKAKDQRMRRRGVQKRLQAAVQKELQPTLPELQGFDRGDPDNDGWVDPEARGPKGPKKGKKGDDDSSDDDHLEEGCVPVNVERPLSLMTVKSRLQRFVELDPSLFDALPEGWARELKETGRRRPQMLFVRTTPAMRDQQGICRNRFELEEEAEKDHERTNAKQRYLGHVANGKWEIRRQHLSEAVEEVVGVLVDRGLLEVVVTAHGESYVPANKYCIGMPFTKGDSKPTSEDGYEAQKSELSEYEQDRQANMARNAAFLASLGL